MYNVAKFNLAQELKMQINLSWRLHWHLTPMLTAQPRPVHAYDLPLMFGLSVFGTEGELGGGVGGGERQIGNG